MHTRTAVNNRVTTLIHNHLAMIALRSANTPLRVNGRTRECLPIDIPAPRPCSAYLSVPPHTNRGSLNGIHMLTLLFAAFAVDYLDCPNPSRKSAICQQLFFCGGQKLGNAGNVYGFHNFLPPLGQRHGAVHRPWAIQLGGVIADGRAIIHGDQALAFQMHQNGAVFL